MKGEGHALFWLPALWVPGLHQQRRSSGGNSSYVEFWMLAASFQLAVGRLMLLLTKEQGEEDYWPIAANSACIGYLSRPLMVNERTFIGNIHWRTMSIHALADLKWRLLTPWCAHILTSWLRIETFLFNNAINAVHVAFAGNFWQADTGRCVRLVVGSVTVKKEELVIMKSDSNIMLQL